MIPRVLISEEAEAVVKQLRSQHGALIFHQSGGCCDGSSPMCFPEDELMLDRNDIWLGEVAGCNFYISKDQFEYWKHTQLTVDITKGRGSSFSLEIPLGLRFIIKSRMYQPHEKEELTPVRNAEELR